MFNYLIYQFLLALLQRINEGSVLGHMCFTY